MHSSQIEFLSAEQVIQLKQLLACDDIRILKKTGGGNSKVFCVEAQGKKWAIKSYPPYAVDQRDRLAAECMVYQFLNQHQVNAVPQFKSSCFKERWLILDWIEGRLPDHYSCSDIEQAIAFIQQVAQLNSTPAAKDLPLAAEACISLDVLIQQITHRFARLHAVTDEPALREFLVNDFSPLFSMCQHSAREGYRQHGMNASNELSLLFRSLIPADFGFHNTLRDGQGQLYFFDFDYFGWDDPVKLLSDILWHPKMHLSAVEKQQFIDGIAGIYHTDPLFLSRFRYTFPLFGLRWVLILLNEFIPAFWQNRQHAEVYHQNEVEVKTQQLKRAQGFLTLVQQQTGQNYELTHTSII